MSFAPAIVAVALAVLIARSIARAVLASAKHSASSDKLSVAALVQATTAHTRAAPARHAFRYPLVLVALDLTARLPPIVTVDGWAPLVVRSADHLADHADLTLQSRIVALAATHCIPEDAIGCIVLVTAPRIFGFAFNPLSVFFVYARADANDLRCISRGDTPLLLAILEVHNTFSERHIYVCSDRKKSKITRKNYDASFEMPRSFHVSPFNNRSGIYEIHLKDIASGDFDILIYIRKYIDTSSGLPNPDSPSSDAIHLTARVSGQIIPLTANTLAASLIAHPFNTFLTFPRILYQAFLLAYRKGLPVFQRPTPYPNRQIDGSETIVRKRPDALQIACQKAVFAHISCLASEACVPVTILLPDASSHDLVPGENVVTLFVDSFNAFVRMVMASNRPLIGLFVAFTAGDVFCTSRDLERLLLMLAHKRTLDIDQPSSKAKPDGTHQHKSIAEYLVACMSCTITSNSGHQASQPGMHSVTDADPLVPLDTDPWKIQIAAGMRLLNLEQLWFKSTTTFVQHGEPWRLPDRAASLAAQFDSDIQKGLDLGAIDDNVREIHDEKGGLAREQLRAYHFLACATRVNLQPIV